MGMNPFTRQDTQLLYNLPLFTISLHNRGYVYNLLPQTFADLSWQNIRIKIATWDLQSTLIISYRSAAITVIHLLQRRFDSVFLISIPTVSHLPYWVLCIEFPIHTWFLAIGACCPPSTGSCWRCYRLPTGRILWLSITASYVRWLHFVTLDCPAAGGVSVDGDLPLTVLLGFLS